MPSATGYFPKYAVGGGYHWGKLAGRGPRRYHARLHARYGWFVAQVSRLDPEVVVDVGCGDAALTHLLAATAPDGRVIGVEPDPDGIESARAALEAASSRAEVKQGSGQALPFEDASVDVVALCEVIEHVEDPGPLLAEIGRILRPEGHLLLSTPQRQPVPADPLHVHEYSAEELGDTCAQWFAQVEILASEPARLVRSYSRAPMRIAVNALCLLGLNPFSLQTRPSRRTANRVQLYARASGPKG